MLPIDTSTLDQYHPDQLVADAKRYGTSELREGAERLIESTPDLKEMRDNAEFVNDNFLKGLPKLSAEQLANLNLEDAEAMAEIILVNVANYYGIPIDSLKVEDWINKGVDYLKEELIQYGKEFAAEVAVEAMAQYGLQSVAQYASNVVPLVGVVTTSYQALEDGELSQGEIWSISASAITASSAMIASSAIAIGLGVIGGIVGIGAIGVALLEGQNAATAEYNRKVRKAAEKATSQEEQLIQKFLNDTEFDYKQENNKLWDRKASAIFNVATDWERFEDSLKRSFQLRYFPGAAPPLRGGWYIRQALRETHAADYMLVKRKCDKISGCLYFPGTDSTLPITKAYPFIQKMREYGYYLSDKGGLIDSKYFALSPYHAGSVAQVYGPEYKYYWRTMRAFDAFVPNRYDSRGYQTGFWVNPSHEFRNPTPFKNYGRLGWDIHCRKKPGCEAYICPQYTGCSESQRSKMGHSEIIDNKEAAIHNDSVAAWDLATEATKYVEDRFSKLQAESNSVETIRTRIAGDLIQTASAVTGEIKTAGRINELIFQLGANPQFASPTAKRSISVLDDTTKKAILESDALNKKTNTGLMLAGGVVAAAGLGVWYAKGKPWPL